MDSKIREFYYSYSKVVSKNSRKVLFSNWFIVFVVLVITITTMLVAFIPLFGGTPINSDAWTFGMRLMMAITFVVAISGILGDLMMDRASKLALPFYITYIILYGVQCYFWALYYEMLQQLLVLILVIISLIKWGTKNSSEENVKIKSLDSNYFLYILIAVVIISFILGLIMDIVVNPWIGNNIVLDALGNIDYENTSKIFWRGEDPYPFMDAFVFITFIAAWVLFTKRYYNAFWMMFICIIGYFIVYGLMAFDQGVNSYVVYFITNFFYLVLNQTGMCNWTIMYLEQEEILPGSLDS